VHSVTAVELPEPAAWALMITGFGCSRGDAHPQAGGAGR
jgi:hypothetical protein